VPITDSNSKNAVSFSSARTPKRLLAALTALQTRPLARASQSHCPLHQIGCEAEGLSLQLKLTPQ
jgi:hypothetical protein